MTKSVFYIKLALPYFPQSASKKGDSEFCHFLLYFKNYIRFQKICLCVLSILFLTFPLSPAGLKNVVWEAVSSWDQWTLGSLILKEIHDFALYFFKSCQILPQNARTLKLVLNGHSWVPSNTLIYDYDLGIFWVKYWNNSGIMQRDYNTSPPIKK